MNRFFPLQIICSYILFGFLVAVFGPVIYFGFDKNITALYLFAIIFAICSGYYWGATTPLPVRTPQKGKQPNLDKIFSISLRLSLIGLLATVIYMIATGKFNFSISNIGNAYSEAYEDYERNSGNYSLDFIIYTIFYAPTFVAEVFGIYYFSSLSRLQKIGILFLIFGSLFTFTIGSGKQKELGDIIIFFLSVYAIKFARKGRIITSRNVAIGIAIITVGVCGFAYILSKRYSAISIDINNINNHTIANMSFDQNNALFSIFGSQWGFALAIFSEYFSQGYYGLSLTLQGSPTWSWMIGFSYSLSAIFNKLLGVPFQYYHTYPYTVGATSGWGESHWYTVFPWFASDFTFVGTIPLFGFFAFIYARSWRESVSSGNPFAILLFTLMTLGAAFIPANNQLFHTPAAFLTLIAVSILYYRYHCLYNYSIRYE